MKRRKIIVKLIHAPMELNVLMKSMTTHVNARSVLPTIIVILRFHVLLQLIKQRTEKKSTVSTMVMQMIVQDTANANVITAIQEIIVKQ